MRSEAHLPRDHRSIGLVRHLPQPKKSFLGWGLLIVFVILNETRGIYVVVNILKAWFG